jgi:hypothetical protein
MTPSQAQLEAVFAALARQRQAACPVDAAAMQCRRVRKKVGADEIVPVWECVCPACGLNLHLQPSDDPLHAGFRPYTPEEIAALASAARRGETLACPVDHAPLRASRDRLKPDIARLVCARCGHVAEITDQPEAAAVVAAGAEAAAENAGPPVPAAAEPAAKFEIQPPSALRVARRTCAMAAVAARALLENEDPGDPEFESNRREILTWVREIGVADELEPDEAKLLHLPVGVPPRQDIINGTWLIEGVGVLAWALGRYRLPPYDELFDPADLLPAIGILDPKRARGMIATSRLRARDELDRVSWQLFTIHWRLQHFALEPRAMNLRAMPKKVMFAHLLDVSACRFIDGDLAIGNQPLERAPTDKVAMCSSAVQERHKAINWLAGDAVKYSDTDTST